LESGIWSFNKITQCGLISINNATKLKPLQVGLTLFLSLFSLISNNFVHFADEILFLTPNLYLLGNTQEIIFFDIWTVYKEPSELSKPSPFPTAPIFHPTKRIYPFTTSAMIFTPGPSQSSSKSPSKSPSKGEDSDLRLQFFQEAKEIFHANLTWGQWLDFSSGDLNNPHIHLWYAIFTSWFPFIAHYFI